MIEMSGRTLQCVCIRKNNPTYEMVWGDSGSVRYSVRNWDGPVIGRGENIFIRRKSDLCAEIVPSAFFSYQKEQGTEREEIFRLPLHVWMPLAGYLEDQTEKKGKGRTGGSIGR